MSRSRRRNRLEKEDLWWGILTLSLLIGSAWVAVWFLWLIFQALLGIGAQL